MPLKEGFAACHFMYRWHYDSQEHGNVTIRKKKKRERERSSMYKAIYSSGEIISKIIEWKDQAVLTESLVWIFSQYYFIWCMQNLGRKSTN